MSPNIEYPKSLPVLISVNHPLESGFTPTEIVALQNGWRMIKRCLNSHAAKIATDFYSENYLLLQKFCNVEREQFNLSTLHRHTYQVMNFYGRLIESGLKDAAFINMLLSEIATRHKQHGVTYDDIKLLTNYTKLYFIKFLDKIKSATFVNGLEKLSELIKEQHREKAEYDGNISRTLSD